MKFNLYQTMMNQIFKNNFNYHCLFLKNYNNVIIIIINFN